MPKTKLPGMTKDELYKILEMDPRDIHLFQAVDAEGNGFCPVESISEEQYQGQKILVIWPRHEQVYLD